MAEQWSTDQKRWLAAAPKFNRLPFHTKKTSHSLLLLFSAIRLWSSRSTSCIVKIMISKRFASLFCY